MICLFSNCISEPFDTEIELNQHYLRAHLVQRRCRGNGEFFCDYQYCDRKSRSFERSDGLRSHLRAAHKEPIPKKGDTSKSASIAGRVDHLGWWRCSKCFQRIDSKHELGYCPSCMLSVGQNTSPIYGNRGWSNAETRRLRTLWSTVCSGRSCRPGKWAFKYSNRKGKKR